VFDNYCHRAVNGDYLQERIGRRTSACAAQPDAAATLGRPSDRRINIKVVSAVLNTLRVGGYGAVTIEGIALKANCARTSLYRRWPSKRHLVAFAVVSEMGRDPAPDTGSLREDLKAIVMNLYRAFTRTLRQSLAGLVGDMAHDAKLAQLIRTEVINARRESMRAALRRACRRGELRQNIDLELLLDMLTAPFYHRVLFGHRAITRGMCRGIVDIVVRAVR
jgi:AcrR family transcriptional regulator